MLKELYYLLKPIIPRPLQIAIRRKIISIKRKKVSNIWPIDENSAKIPKEWPGWPNGKKFALILTHDVDTKKGYDKCLQLLKLEKEMCCNSSFNFVPERYEVSSKLLKTIVKNGFEIGVHGLKHDGKLYKTRKIFIQRAKIINKYLHNWNSIGFRSPAMHHNLTWLHDLDILYDMSTFDTDPFEPQSDGMGTIFPFWVQNHKTGKAYLELPYTLCQDFTLFILLQEKTIDIWKKKADWIIENGGMILINVHPDYMKFNSGSLGLEEYPVLYYKDFLSYIKNTYYSESWNVLPKDLAIYCKENLPH